MKHHLIKLILLLTLSTSFISTQQFIGNTNTIYVTEFKTKTIKPIEPKEIDTDILTALIYVESRGLDSAYNSSEDAVGCLQIRPIMVREVNRILRKTGKEERFEMKDRWNRDKSIEMFHIWREYHHPNSTDEVIARNWNGGPDGYIQNSTLKYWKKVKGRLEIES
jgi:hypothetical protein